MEWINSFTPSNMLTFLLICASLLWLFNLIGQSVKTFREMRKPKDTADKSVADKLAEHDRYLAADKHRLEMHDKEINELREGMRHNCTGVKALLNHQLHNGNTREMEEAASELDTWLINR